MSDWRTNLNGFFDKAEQKTQKEVTSDFNSFISDTVVSAFDQLAEELRQRSDQQHVVDAPAVYVVVNGLQRIKALRFVDDFSFSLDDADSPANPGALLNDLICQGAIHGMHTIVACGTVNDPRICMGERECLRTLTKDAQQVRRTRTVRRTRPNSIP